MPDGTQPKQYYREDYRRTTRQGQKVYCLIADPEQIIPEEDFRSLRYRPVQNKRGLLGLFGGKDEDLRLKSSPERPQHSKTGGGVLSAREAVELREPYIAALRDNALSMDKGLWWFSQDASEPQIWSNLADAELAIIANVSLRRGQQNPAIANFVRSTVEMSEDISLFVIAGPRLIQSGQQMGKRPKRARKSRV